MQFLLVTLHLSPSRLKPSKGIIIDDLDHFIILDRQVLNDNTQPTNWSNLNEPISNAMQGSAPKLGSTSEYMKLIQTSKLSDEKIDGR